MQDRTPLGAAEEDLQTALASLSPATTGIGAESLWYEARLLIERRRTRRWRVAASIAIAAGAASTLWRPKAAIVTVDRTVLVREQGDLHVAPTPPAPAPADDHRSPAINDGAIPMASLRLRDALLQNGPQGLPATAAGEDETGVQRAWAPPESQIGLEHGSRSDGNFFRGG